MNDLVEIIMNDNDRWVAVKHGNVKFGSAVLVCG